MTFPLFLRWLNRLLERVPGAIILLLVISTVFSPIQFVPGQAEAQTATVLYVNPPSQNV